MPRETPERYRGRFAPSPTGALHFGSLVAALGSYLPARQAQGQWLIRIEDIDVPRAVPGCAAQIIEALSRFGFEWSEPVVYQSSRTELYATALQRLLESGFAYECSCSRKDIELSAPLRSSDGELRYPGWCRQRVVAPERERAIRFRAPDGAVEFHDEIQGRVAVDVFAEVGDFVIRRRDGLFAYQLAVVVDDADQGITQVVRGADLLHNTPRQLLVQQALGYSTPRYAHLPLATDAKGVKLSKSTGAAALDLAQPARELWRALAFLRQAPPIALQSARLTDLWGWAIGHWNMSLLVEADRSRPVTRDADGNLPRMD